MREPFLREKGETMGNHIVACPVCGMEIPFPPAPEIQSVPCPACNTSVSRDAASAIAGLGVGLPSPPAAPTATATSPASRPPGFKANALRSLLWGAGVAVIGGLAMALVSRRLLASPSPAAVFGGAEFGIFSGFLLGFVWGMVRSFDLTYTAGTTIAAALGLCVAVAHHIVDLVFISSAGDEPIYVTAIFGCGAGIFVGAVCVWFKNYRDNA